MRRRFVRRNSLFIIDHCCFSLNFCENVSAPIHEFGGCTTARHDQVCNPNTCIREPPPPHLSIPLSFSLATYLSIYSSIYLSIYLSIYIYIHLPILLIVRQNCRVNVRDEFWECWLKRRDMPFLSLSLTFSLSLSIYLSIYLSLSSLSLSFSLFFLSLFLTLLSIFFFLSYSVLLSLHAYN